MITKAQLASVCEPEGRSLCAHPWKLANDDWKGFATDGKVAIFTKAAPDGLEEADHANTSKALGINKPTGTEHLVDFKELREWVGEYEADKPCEECDGKGMLGKTGSTECLECGGDGKDGPVIREGRLFGILIDRNRLARAMDLVEAEQVTIRCGNPDDKNGGPLYFDGPDWRIILMSMVGEVKDAPEFSNELAKA